MDRRPNAVVILARALRRSAFISGRGSSFRRGLRLAALSSALLLLGQLGSGCTEDDALLVTLTAEAKIDTFDLYVLDQSRKEIVLSQVGEIVDADDPTRDLSVDGDALRLVLQFERKGSYLVHIVGRSNGPLQASSHIYYINGTQRRSIHLVVVGDRDLDGDGFLTRESCEALGSGDINCSIVDCDDSNEAINPLATEICGNGVDEDCDGEDAECRDADGDGSPENEDCDDNDPLRSPDFVEAVNDCPTAEHPDGVSPPNCGDGIDQDCDGQDTACVVDEDCDGSAAAQDCNDHDPTIHPGASEICNNGVDENCNGEADEGCVECDLDGDGFERDDAPYGCPLPDYPAGRPTDCNDFDAGQAPQLTDACGGQEGGTLECALLQLCDGIDNDCDGLVDEGCPDPSCDGDHDGFQPAGGGCSPPAGQEDCDDTDPTIYPGAPDRCGDSILQNCYLDSPCSTDGDGDGYNDDVDCNDADPNIHPFAIEKCNGVDDDCDGLVDEGNPDADGAPLGDVYCNDDMDGICGDAGGPGRCICSKVSPATHRDPTNRIQCVGEDLSAVASPRCFFAPQPDVEQCDPTDHDCDGAPDDPDGSNLLELGQPCGIDTGQCVAGHVVGCDLTADTYGALNNHFLCDAAFAPPQTELCNGLDDDCDGQLPSNEQDPDGDHYMSCTGCPASLPAPLLGCEDCAPQSPNRYPGAPERCNGLDDNCQSGTSDDGAGVCGGQDCCGGLNLCTDLGSDFGHCGDCYHGCDPFTASLCSGGSCRCGTGGECGWGKECVGSGSGASCQCTAASCPNGCCSGDTCVPYGSQSNGSCGTGGESCHGCTNGRTCSGSGVCLCYGAVSPPNETQCDDNVDNDCDGQVDCNDGHCDGRACGSFGTVCVGNQCRCTTGSCPGGCCSGDTCVPYSSQSTSSCGTGGESCHGCVSGQQCSNSGTCTCTASSCPGGCCSGTSCVPYSSQSTSSCGTGGESCHGCVSGQQCSNSGVCICTASSCPGGCCSGTSCVPYGSQSASTCGTGGQACSSCSSGQDCSGSGTCICTAGSCPSGCCSGTSCVPYGSQSNGSCGTGGETCHGCASPRTCGSGQCLCYGSLNPPPESNCDDTIDNDCDGDLDCADSDCDGQTCDGTWICTGGACPPH